jgi:hypothetical protein
VPSVCKFVILDCFSDVDSGLREATEYRDAHRRMPEVRQDECKRNLSGDEQHAFEIEIKRGGLIGLKEIYGQVDRLRCHRP